MGPFWRALEVIIITTFIVGNLMLLSTGSPNNSVPLTPELRPDAGSEPLSLTVIYSMLLLLDISQLSLDSDSSFLLFLLFFPRSGSSYGTPASLGIAAPSFSLSLVILSKPTLAVPLISLSKTEPTDPLPAFA